MSKRYYPNTTLYRSFDDIARLQDEGKVIGWFQVLMEYGPRALGGLSIIGDPLSRTMQSTMNLKIKYRESFRPFAPAIKAERVGEWFEQDRPSPYMLVVAPVAEQRRLALDPEAEQQFGIDQLKVARSEVPAVTHVDCSARIQTVHAATNPRFYALLDAFERRTGCPILGSTSLTVRGEPTVCKSQAVCCCF